MDRSRGAGVSPPQQAHARAGIMGAKSMVTWRIRLIRTGFLLGLLALLVSGTSLAPRQAVARPVFTGGPDPTYGTGDPTGDDVPSPTPKPTALRVPNAAAKGVTQIRVAGTSISWNIYWSIALRLGIR